MNNQQRKEFEELAKIKGYGFAWSKEEKCYSDDIGNRLAMFYQAALESPSVRGLASSLKECLEIMEADRASGDCGRWEWSEDSEYTKGMKALAEFEGDSHD